MSMPLTMARCGSCNCIKKITGKDETKRFLENLGFVEGAPVKVITEIGGNVILSVKDTRVALDRSMANRIMI